MKVNKKQKLLAAITVFTFVAFCFAITNTFGSTYAATTYICPYGWEFDNFTKLCDRVFKSNEYVDEETGEIITQTAKEVCYDAIEVLGLEVGIQKGGILGNVCNDADSITEGHVWAVESGTGYTFTATLNGNGGTLSTTTASCEAYNEDEACTTSDLPIPTRTGYTFKGWSQERACPQVFIKDNIKIDDTIKYTYYACWEAEKYEVKFNAGEYGNVYDKVGVNGHEMGLKDQEYGSTILLPIDKKTDESHYALREGYKLTGWTTTEGNCSNPLTGTVSVQSNVTYYACWESSDSGSGDSGSGDSGSDGGNTTVTRVTFKFYVNGGDTISKNDDYCDIDVGASTCPITFPTAERRGHDLKGWSRDPNCSSEYNTFTSKINANADMNGDKFYACWEEKKEEEQPEETIKYNITFNPNRGSLYVNGNKTTTTSYSLTEIDYSKYEAKLTDHNFIGWRTSNQTCANAKKTGTVTLDKNIRLIACYKDNSGITPENPNTGSTLLYLAYLAGILALCYTIVCSYRVIKLKK